MASLPHPARISRSRPPFRILGVALLLLAVSLGMAGCQKSSRFASGTEETMGPPLSQEMLTQWRPPDPSDFETPSSPTPAPRPTPAAEPAEAANQLKVPANWSPPTRSRPWRWVVVHHSATHDGGAAEFDKEHRANGWDELGYHFVIGNGTDTPDGYVEVGPRWHKQKHGAHAKTPDNRFNELGVGICLVGHFDQERPTQKQMQSLAVLTAYLMDTYDIPASRVIGHGDTKSTACPGHNLYAQLDAIRRVASRAVAQDVFAGSKSRDRTVAASVRP